MWYMRKQLTKQTLIIWTKTLDNLVGKKPEIVQKEQEIVWWWDNLSYCVPIVVKKYN